MSFSYRKGEDSSALMAAYGDRPRLAERVLEERGQHFLWAFLVSEVTQQVAVHLVERRKLIAERIEAAEVFWTAETESIRVAANWSETILVERLDFFHFAVSITVGKFPSVDRKAVEFGMDPATGNVVMRCVGVSLPTHFRDVKHVEDARQLATERIKATVRAIAEFEPKFPELGIR